MPTSHFAFRSLPTLLCFAFWNSSKYDQVSFHRKHEYLIFRIGRQVGQVVGGGKHCDLLNLFVTLCTRNNFRTTFEYTPLAFVNLALKTLLLALTPLNIYNWFIIYKKVSKMAPLSNGYWIYLNEIVHQQAKPFNNCCTQNNRAFIWITHAHMWVN